MIMIVLMIMITAFDIEDDETRITGYAENIHQSENGFVFTIMDTDGNETKAFVREQVDGSLHVFNGNYSSDGKIFFVSSIE